jgi:YcaO cyclodehydratase, ATP-ad Mg2+-binding
VTTTDLSPQVKELMQLVSPRVGLIRSLTRSPRGPIEPNPPIIYHALLSHFDFKRAKQSERIAAGKGASESEAIGSAIGEAVERYCASHVNQQALRHANWQVVGSSAISPAESEAKIQARDQLAFC